MKDVHDSTALMPGFRDVDEPVRAPSAGGPRHSHRRTRAGKQSKRRKVLIGLAAFVVVLLVAAGGVVYALSQHYSNNVKRVGDVFAGIDNRPKAAPNGVQNFLLVGSDSRAGEQTTGAGHSNAKSPIGQRSDTIMIVHLPADRSSATVVSIPRDSWVSIPGRGQAKINAAFAYGGPTLLIQTVERLTGIRIDHYAQIDFGGFKSMTAALGGVDVNVAKTFTDPKTGHVYPQGINHLDGDQALAFVRQRHGLAHGDFDRMKNQQAFLKGLMSEASGQLTNPVALAKLLDAVTSSVSVDSGLSSGDMRSLALSMRNIRGGDVRFLTVPTSGTGREGAQSVVYIDDAQAASLFQAIKNNTVASWSEQG